jgi:hypothetical protein
MECSHFKHLAYVEIAVANSFECGNKRSGPIKFWEILELMNNWWLLRDRAPWC